MSLTRVALSLVFALAGFPGQAQAAPEKATPPATTPAQQILELERLWVGAIQRRDKAAMVNFLADGYFLAIGAAGGRLKVVPRAAWLETLSVYETRSFSFDDVQVHTYGDTAVVVMLFSQEATVRGQDRSAQFVITDIWVKGPNGWRVAERHSSRPEPALAARP